MADLVTLARAQLGIPAATSDDDAWLESLIDAASAAIETWCGRHFVAADYTEFFDGRQDGVIVLNEYPIQYITRIMGQPQPVVKTYSEVAGFGTTVGTAAVRVTSTGVVYRSPTTGTYVTATYLYSANSLLLSTLKIAIESDALYSWAFEIDSGYEFWPSANLAIQGPVPLGDRSKKASLKLFVEDLEPADADYAAGMVFLNAPPVRNAGRIEYRAGYDTVPEDVQEACVQLVKMMFESGQVSSIMHRERLGDYSYQLKELAGSMVYSLPPSVFALLSPYRNRRVLG